MKFLYVPWRSNYVKADQKTKKENADPQDCTFCTKLIELEDEKNIILARFKCNSVFLNLYPYNTGHLLIIPNKHVKNLHDLDKNERSELMELINQSINIIEQELKPEGFNIGMNLGKSSGAGIPSHLHMHIIPRWLGDTNFLPLIADVKMISFDLLKIYSNLKPKFQELIQSLDNS